MFKILLSILGLAISGCSFADQRIVAKEGNTIHARVSNTALNRIVVEGDRIQSVKGISGQFQMDKDPYLGQIFIQPAIENKEPVHLFLTTETGATYTLNLEASDAPAESVILVPKLQQSVAAKWEKSGSYEQIITNIIKSLHNQTPLEGFSIENFNTKQSKVRGASTTHQLSFVGEKLQGQRLEVHNAAKNSIELKEADFYQPGIRAIAVLNKFLRPKEKTAVYLVRDR